MWLIYHCKNAKLFFSKSLFLFSRSDDLKGCVYKFLGEVEPCLAEGQKSSKYTLQNITEAILKFVCENEGDHIARKYPKKKKKIIFHFHLYRFFTTRMFRRMNISER